MADEAQPTITETVTTTETPPADPPAEPEPDPEAATEPASETPTVVVVPVPSSTPSAPAEPVTEMAALERQNKLLRDNLELVFRRLDQLDQMLTGTLAPFQAALEELDTTSEAMQLVINRQDEQQEQLAVALVALAKATTELSQIATMLHRAPTSRN